MRRSDDPGGPWAPYVPDEAAPWDLPRVVHLHRRAGFAATWEELQRDLADGPEASVTRLLQGTSRAYALAGAFESTAGLLADAAVASGDPARLEAWWVYRMLFGPDPLGERLTLMLHDHFATGNAKVNDLAAMRRQNETFRRLARGPFGELLAEMLRDPALLAWLDAPANRKGHPNENLARELLELFTLGIGHYGEPDVKEAARALTGWTVERAEARFVPGRHDDGEKTVLGRTGPLDADALVALLLEQPATARRLARRLAGVFFGEGALGDEAIDALADDLRSNGLDLGQAVATILRSRLFFAPANLRTRVVGPVEFVVATARALELLDPPPSTLVLADWSARLGQRLFNPPNVGGWPGGRAWLSARTVIGRANFAAALIGGRGVGRPDPFDPATLADRHGRTPDPESLIAFVADLLLGAVPGGGWAGRVTEALGPAVALGPDTARRAVALVLASPEAQVA